MNDTNFYIARDKDRTLGIYAGKPTYNKEYDTFDCNDNLIDYIDSDLYPEVTFENSPVLLKPIINHE